MDLQILQKQLDESSHCPLCQASMYWVEAEQYTQELQFHECSHCQHRIFQQESKLNCHCAQCTAARKKQTQQTRLQEQRKYSTKDEVIYSLNQLSFLHKLFFLPVCHQAIFELFRWQAPVLLPKFALHRAAILFVYALFH